jgi:hypothetical protein
LRGKLKKREVGKSSGALRKKFQAREKVSSKSPKPKKKKKKMKVKHVIWSKCQEDCNTTTSILGVRTR